MHDQLRPDGQTTFLFLLVPNEPSRDAQDLVQERWAAPARPVWTTAVPFPALLAGALCPVSRCGLCRCPPVLPAESPSSAHSPLLALGSALATAVVAFGDEGKEMVEEWDVEREWGGRCPGDHGGDGQGGRHPEVGCRK